MITNKSYEVHGSRLKFYSDASLDVNEELLAHVGNQGMVLGVDAVKNHRKERGSWQLLISWVGLQESEDSWESLNDMNSAVPARVAEYVVKSDDLQLRAAHEAIKRGNPIRT